MKIAITVHQLQLSAEECRELNRVGRERAYLYDPKFQAHDEVKRGSPHYKPEYWKHYSLQGTVNVEVTPDKIQEILEQVFAAGNDMGYGALAEAGKYFRFTTAHSISVGDIILVAETAWMVDPCGFSQVEISRESLATISPVRQVSQHNSPQEDTW